MPVWSIGLAKLPRSAPYPWDPQSSSLLPGSCQYAGVIASAAANAGVASCSFHEALGLISVVGALPGAATLSGHKRARNGAGGGSPGSSKRSRTAAAGAGAGAGAGGGGDGSSDDEDAPPTTPAARRSKQRDVKSAGKKSSGRKKKLKKKKKHRQREESS